MKALTTAPVVVFAYKRVAHLRLCIQHLQNNTLAPSSDLIVYSDGPRTENDKEGVLEVRRFLKTVSGFASVKVIEHEGNLGLSKSIILNVTKVVNEYGSVVVVEDDLVTSPYFLQYMNDALKKYQFEDKVISIHGYVYPVKGKLPDLFFLRGADCWGWATWKRGWDLFNADGRALLARIARMNENKRFDFSDTYPYIQMLKDQIERKNDSWAILWYASAFVEDKLTLYPGRSLVRNIGNDDSGTHSRKTNKFDVELSSEPVDVFGAQVKLEDNPRAILEFSRYFRALKSPLDNLKAFVKRMISYY